jgi:hypothetical protein
MAKMSKRGGSVTNPYNTATGPIDLSKRVRPQPTSGAVRPSRPVGDFIGAPGVEDSVIRGQKMTGVNKQMGDSVTRKAQARAKKLQG